MEQEGRQVLIMANRNIENIVVTTSLSQQLPLQTLAVSIQNAEYHDEDPLLIFRFDDPKRAVFLTEQGLISCTGVTNLEQGKQVIYQVINILKDHAIPIQHMPDVRLQSFVISINPDRIFDLDEIRMKLPADQIIYQPENNPWIEYLFDEYLTFLISIEGTIVCTGTESIDHAHQAIDTLLQVLE